MQRCGGPQRAAAAERHMLAFLARLHQVDCGFGTATLPLLLRKVNLQNCKRLGSVIREFGPLVANWGGSQKGEGALRLLKKLFRGVGLRPKWQGQVSCRAAHLVQ